MYRFFLFSLTNRRMTRLAIIISLLTGMLGAFNQQSSARADTSEWQTTLAKINFTYALPCIDGTHANILLVPVKTANSGTAAGSYTLNWQTGELKLINATPFDKCDSASGYLYGKQSDGSLVRFSSTDPKGQVVNHIPGYFATDGSLQFYAVESVAGPIYSSSDGGLTWTQHAVPIFSGGHISRFMLTQNDARAVYALACVGDELFHGCRVYFSDDAGVNWEDRGSNDLAGELITLQSLPGANSSRDELLSVESVTGLITYRISLDGGRSFEKVAELSGDGPHTYTGNSFNIFKTSLGLLRVTCNSIDCTVQERPAGQAWQTISGLPSDISKSGSRYFRLQQFSTTPDSLILNDYHGSIWLSKDAGHSWQQVTASPSDNDFSFLTPYSPTTLLDIPQYSQYSSKIKAIQTLDLSQADPVSTDPAQPGLASGGNYLDQLIAIVKVISNLISSSSH